MYILVSKLGVTFSQDKLFAGLLCKAIMYVFFNFPHLKIVLLYFYCVLIQQLLFAQIERPLITLRICMKLAAKFKISAFKTHIYCPPNN